MAFFLLSVGTLVPILLFLVVIHELGHFATARSLGVKVLEFGVGFPPRASHACAQSRAGCSARRGSAADTGGDTRGGACGAAGV